MNGQGRLSELVGLGVDHGCLTGDCPCANSEECMKHMAELVAEWTEVGKEVLAALAPSEPEQEDRCADCDNTRRDECCIPEPVPEPEQGPACDDCGRPYGEEHGFPDLVVPHHVWNESLGPNGDSSGLLCPSCLCKRAHDAGVQCEARFTSGPFVVPEQGTEDAPKSAPMADVVDFIRGRASWYRMIEAGGGGKLTAELAGSDAEALEMVATFCEGVDKDYAARLSRSGGEPKGDRVETGPVRFGDDWAGVFIRGDNAAHYGGQLDSVIQLLPDELEHIEDSMAKSVCEGLRDLLWSCHEPCDARQIALRASLSGVAEPGEASNIEGPATTEGLGTDLASQSTVGGAGSSSGEDLGYVVVGLDGESRRILWPREWPGMGSREEADRWRAAYAKTRASDDTELLMTVPVGASPGGPRVEYWEVEGTVGLVVGTDGPVPVVVNVNGENFYAASPGGEPSEEPVAWDVFSVYEGGSVYEYTISRHAEDWERRLKFAEADYERVVPLYTRSAPGGVEALSARVRQIAKELPSPWFTPARINRPNSDIEQVFPHEVLESLAQQIEHEIEGATTEEGGRSPWEEEAIASAELSQAEEGARTVSRREEGGSDG